MLLLNPRHIVQNRQCTVRCTKQTSPHCRNPFGFDHTLSAGVISGLDRDIRSQAGSLIPGGIQCDAAINPGAVSQFPSHTSIYVMRQGTDNTWVAALLLETHLDRAPLVGMQCNLHARKAFAVACFILCKRLRVLLSASNAFAFFTVIRLLHMQATAAALCWTALVA